MKDGAAVLFCAGAVLLAGANVSPQAYLDDVKYLASPELKGRATGSPELEKAAQFIAQKFQSFGLKPVSGKSYLQPFTVSTNAHLGPANSLAIDEGGQKSQRKAGVDYTPYSFSSSGKLSGAVVFAGYGITAADYRYDDYEGI